MTGHFLFHCLSLIFYSAYWIEWWILSHCHRVQSKLKTAWEENIMLTLRQCFEMDAVVTLVYWNLLQEKYKFLNYQEYWSSENCSLKGCPFRATKFLLLHIKLVEHWIMVIIISVRDGVQGLAGRSSPLKKKKKLEEKNLDNFPCQIFGERVFLVVNVTLNLIFPK